MALIGDIGARLRLPDGCAVWQAATASGCGARPLRCSGSASSISARALTDRLPKGLYARSILIVVMPILILQAVVAYVFMERHWQTVTRRLSSAVVARHRGRDRGHRDLSAGHALLRDHAHRRRHLRPDDLRAAARSAAGGRPAAVLLAPRLDALARDPPPHQPALLDRHGRQFRHGRDPHRPRRPRAARVRAAQPRLRLELAHLSALDGRHVAGASDDRAPLPAQPDQADPDARRGRRAIRQGPAGRRRSGRAARARCGRRRRPSSTCASASSGRSSSARPCCPASATTFAPC